MSTIKEFWERNLIAPKVLYFTMNLAYYSCYTFRAKYLNQQQGIETKEYGLIAAVLSLVVFFAGFFWSFLSDKMGNSKSILIWSALISAAVFQCFIPKFGNLKIPLATLVSGAYIFFTSAFIPLLDAFVMNMLSSKKGMTKDMYGRQRMFGTIGYAVIAIVVSYLPLFPTINIFIVVLSVLFAGCVYFMIDAPEKKIKYDIESSKEIISTSVTKPDKAHSKSASVSTLNEIDMKQDVKPVQKSGGLTKLLTNPNFLFLLLVVFMNGLARAVMTHFLEPIQRNVYKTPASATGFSAASGVALEVGVFFFSKDLLAYLGVRRMLLISQTAMVCRICCYAFLPRSFPGSSYIPIVYELFKGLSFGFMQSASDIWVTEITTPDTKAVGQAIYTGVFSGIAAFAAGLIGYLVQSIGVEDYHLMTKFQKIEMEVQRSSLLLTIMAIVSIFALILFFVCF